MSVWNYTFMAVGLLVLFQFAGIPMGQSSLFDYLGVTFDSTNNTIQSFGINGSDFLTYIIDALFGTLLGIGVAATLLVSGKSDIAINAGIATAILISFLPVYVFPVTYAIAQGFPAWTTGVLAIVFIPLAFGYLTDLFKYVTGGGN